MEEKLVKIYVLKHPITNEICYVGRSLNPSTRYRNHIHLAKKSTHKNQKDAWICSLLNINLKPIMEIIDSCPMDLSTETEKYWIEEYRKTCNLKNTRDYIENDYLFSIESREKMSKSAKGNTSKRGSKLSEEGKKRIGDSKRGLKHSDESKALTSRIVLQYDKNGKLIKEWPSTKEAAKVLNLHQSLISLTALGRKYRKTTGGFVWKYKN